MRAAMRSADQNQKTCSGRNAPSLAVDFADLIRALRGLIDPYRPERYYMRGPGPKWRAKQGFADGTA